jgi:transcriptional regulator with XRE-family HTH domain
MPKNAPPLGCALLCMRSAVGWLQGELAAAAGISPSLISDYERGRKTLSVGRLRSLVATLGLDLSAIDHALRFLADTYRGRGDALALLEVDAARSELTAYLRASGDRATGAGIPAAETRGRRVAPAQPAASLREPRDARDAQIEGERRRLIVAQLRLLRGWSQKQLAAASGVAASSISDYERGASVPTRNTIDRLAAAAEISRPQLARIMAFVSVMVAGPEGDGEGEGGWVVVPQESGAFPRIEVSAPCSAGERQQAILEWSRLARYTLAERHLELERNPAQATWSLCELICANSLTRAPDNPARALDLADLALRVAQLCSGPREWQLRLLGYARAHRANAHRATGNLPAAASELATAKHLWGAGAAASPGPLNGTKLASLEASLQLCRMQPQKAMETLESALQAPHPQELTVLLINKMRALSDLGRHRQAIAVSRPLAEALNSQADPRLAACARLMLVGSLCAAGRARRAESLLPGLESELLHLGNEVDLVRLDAARAWVANELGNFPLAIEILREVRGAFLARNLEIDAAWSEVRLSRLLMRCGRTVEAKALNRHGAAILHQGGIRAAWRLPP